MFGNFDELLYFLGIFLVIQVNGVKGVQAYTDKADEARGGGLGK